VGGGRSRVAGGALALGFAAGVAQAQELTVYTALEADQLEEYKAAFEADNAGISASRGVACRRSAFR